MSPLATAMLIPVLLQSPQPTRIPSRSTTSTATRLCLVRHGETDWNTEKRVQGQIDIGLNSLGEEQARALRQGLAAHDFAAVYSSDLSRAWSTAVLAMADLTLVDPLLRPETSLRERHYGVLQGMTPEMVQHQLPHAWQHHRARTPDYDFESGESLIDFAGRVMAGLTEIALRHRGGSVLAFTHGGVLDVVHRAASGRPLDAPRDFTIPNAGLNWVEHVDGRWTLLAWADCRHLDRALDEVV